MNNRSGNLSAVTRAILVKTPYLVEGYYGARSVHRVAQRLNVDMPIVEQIYDVLYEDVSPHDAVAALMRRPVMSELT